MSSWALCLLRSRAHDLHSLLMVDFLGNNVHTVSDSGDPPVSATTASGASATASTAPGRLKGKARKETKKAKKQQQVQQPPSSSKPPKKYRVSTEEILRQADFLKNLGESLVMSKTVWAAFKEAIRGRQLSRLR
jgi:hypothetical protein